MFLEAGVIRRMIREAGLPDCLNFKIIIRCGILCLLYDLVYVFICDDIVTIK